MAWLDPTGEDKGGVGVCALGLASWEPWRDEVRPTGVLVPGLGGGGAGFGGDEATV